MNIRIALVFVASMGLFAAGCNRSEDTSSAADAQAPPAATAEAPTVPASAAPSSEVASYPEQVTQSGTVKLTQYLKVHQAADPNSTLLTRLGPGTVVEKKASYGDWMLINWPSGVGQLSPGWTQATYLAPVVVDAGVPPAPDGGFQPDAGPLVDAGRPSIIPPPTRPTVRPTTEPPPAGTTQKRPTFKVAPK